jgi:hypothetical protein
LAVKGSVCLAFRRVWTTSSDLSVKANSQTDCSMILSTFFSETDDTHGISSAVGNLSFLQTLTSAPFAFSLDDKLRFSSSGEAE